MDDQINLLIESVSKSFGQGSLMMLGETPEIQENQFDRISSNFYEVDWALNGGLVRGTQVEFYGPEAGGKTTLALTMLAAFQQFGCQAYYVDAEHKLNLEYAQKLGVNTDDLLLTQPNFGEQAIDIMRDVIGSGLIDVVVVDSVTALVPLADINNDTTDVNIGAHARLMSKMCRIMTPLASRNKTLIIYINQIRHKIAVMFGSPETTTGGNALKFFCGVRARISSSPYKKNDIVDETKRKVMVDFKKNQWGMPYRKVELLLNLGKGFDKGYDMVQYGLREGILIKKGSHISFRDGEVIGNGIANASKTLIEDKDIGNHYDELMEAKNG